jgi:AcrR family transcriptional regulator
MQSSATRERLLDAAKSLVWERGVEATSPNMLLERSGVGKGSLYHFFASKQRWAVAAIDALAADLTVETEALFEQAEGGAAGISAYLSKSRAALDGCRLGRLAFDPQAMADSVLRAPIGTFFDRLRELLRKALSEGGNHLAGRADEVAEAVCAVVQGGYVVARLSDDAGAQQRACAGLLALLNKT